MARRNLALSAVTIILLGVLGGCGAASDVTFTNLADSWVNVRFFVGGKPGSEQLLSKRNFQVRPGETTKFKIRRKTRRGMPALVHMQVQSVTPSWDPPGKEYWMELLTQEPIKIVASGEGEKLDFEIGDGEVASIPKRQLRKRFDHRIVGVPQDEP